MGGSNKKKPQRTGSKKESISKILKNSEFNQKNLNNNSIVTNVAAIVKASSMKQTSDNSSSGNSQHSSNSGLSSISSSSSGSGFNIKLFLLCLLYFARFGFVLLPQHGYIMPDEYFQSTEPIAGDYLNISSLKTWEFNTNFPLRSMFFSHALFCPIYFIIKLFGQNSEISNYPNLLPNITAYSLLVGPRLVITLCSLLIDYSVLKICKILYSPGQNSGIFLTTKMLDILLIHASSYLAFTYYCHTFSNTIETILFSLLLLWIIDSTTTSSKGRNCPNIRIGAVLALGFFNRPTFALYVFVPLLTWLSLYTPSSSSNPKSKLISKNSRSGLFVGTIKNIIVNSIRLLAPFTIFTVLMILTDTWYYRGSDKIVEFIMNIQQFKTEDLFNKLVDMVVLTPANFMIYNLQTKNLSNHGLHPFYFHILVNFPLMFSLLAILWIFDASKKLFNGRFRLNCCGINILYGSIAWILITFSAIPHQEPRFLLGLIVPLVCLIGHQIYSSTILFTFWIIFNAILTVFYGHIHQSGVTGSLFDIRNNLIADYHNKNISLEHIESHIIFVRQYLPPRHLLAIPKSYENIIKIHDLSILDFPSTFNETITNLKLAKNINNIYITGPNNIFNDIEKIISEIMPKNNIKNEKNYFPHFTFEDFDKSFNILSNHHSDDKNNSFTTRLYRAFSFGLWKINYHEHDSSYVHTNEQQLFDQ